MKKKSSSKKSSSTIHIEKVPLQPKQRKTALAEFIVGLNTLKVGESFLFKVLNHHRVAITALQIVLGRTFNADPIETAPKDGTVILVCNSTRYPHTVACVVWEPTHESWACSWDNWPLEVFVATHWRLLDGSSPEEPTAVHPKGPVVV